MKKMVPGRFACVLLICWASTLWGIEVTNETNPVILLHELTGGSVSSVGNPYLNGDPAAFGTYQNASGLWGLNPGIVLSSGRAEDYSDGPNTSGSFSTGFGAGGHADLTALVGQTTFDAASFGFDFRATQDTISYEFNFGSDEYPEYVGSSFDDGFGGWLTDRNGNKTQLSFDNFGNRVSINSAWMSANPGTELDGTTGKLLTTANVVPGQNYSFEFAIADASDSIYDSTVYLSNFAGAGDPIGVYGLFVGVQQSGGGVTLQGDDQAWNLHDTISGNLPNFKHGTVLTANLDLGEAITPGQIEAAIGDLAAQMQPGDQFIYYSITHGGTLPGGLDETTISPGDEALWLGETLWDDELATFLDIHMAGMEKWVMVDACHSGGFWGNDNPGDVGDLDKLDIISLFAAADENTLAYFEGATGLPYFGSSLVDAFSLDGDGFLLADADKNYDLTFDELTTWVQGLGGYMDGTTVYELGLGDPHTGGLATPVSSSSPGFLGGFGGAGPAVALAPSTGAGGVTPVPVPSTAVLCGLGLGCSSLFRLKRKRRKG